MAVLVQCHVPWLYQQPKADVGCCQCMCRTAPPKDTCINALMLADTVQYLTLSQPMPRYLV